MLRENISRVIMLLVLFSSLSYVSDAMQLLSIEGINLSSKEYVSGFKIETWGLNIRAVCHLQPGWIISTGSYASPEGIFEGGSRVGAANLDNRRLQELKNLFLIDDPDLTIDPSATTPPTFKGKIVIGTYGLHPSGDLDDHEVP